MSALYLIIGIGVCMRKPLDWQAPRKFLEGLVS
jgi:hypothetical protein